MPSPDFSYYKTNNVENDISKKSLDGSGGTIAETTRYYYQDDFNGNTIDRFTIEFDESEDWSTDGGSNSFDVESVAAHELGHSLGLKHSSNFEATMYSALAKGDTSKRSLEQDDKDGLNAIY